MARKKDPGPIASLSRDLSDITGVVRGPHPSFVEPQLATLRAQATASTDYVHEIKFDGYRLQARMREAIVSLWTRGGLDWTHKFQSVAAGAGRIPARNFIIDGEVISQNEHGAANFSALQDDISKRRFDRMAFYAFDLLYLDGFDLRGASLIERKGILERLLKNGGSDIAPVLYSEHFDDSGPKLFARSCELGLEGIISKFKGAPYRSGRSEAWLKAKCLQVGRYEVIGYKNGVTSLYLGRREGDEFLYAGKAGTGYTNQMIIELGKLIKPITRKKSPLTKKATHKIDCWVEPKYWAEVAYRDITAHGHLRHVTFRGLYSTQKAKQPLVAKFR
jgi:bifunctional non-homologous end joining protein LigD